MHISLARKYRPKTFASVSVQSHVSNTLKGAIARGRVAHGYLLCGPRGVGKTTLARVLAMALNCERQVQLRGEASGAPHDSAAMAAARIDAAVASGEPCGECGSCTRIWSGSPSLDVVEIDAASNRGVDDARELRERAMYAPSSEAHYKVYIVDEAHMLTREAWNALLKILEEPPPRVVFVFATTEPQKIATTAAPVLSRLQRFDFKRISPADVRERLTVVLAEEGVESEPEALVMLSRAADGSMRDALSLADQALALGDGRLTADRVRDALGLVPEDEYLMVLDQVTEGRAGELFSSVARLVDAGVDLAVFFSGFADTLRAQLAITVGGDVPELSDRAREALQQRAGRLGSGDLLRMLGAVTEAEPRFRRSAQQRLLLEALLVRFALMDRTVALEDVLRTLGGDGGQAPAPRERPRPPAPAPRDEAASRPARSSSDPAVPPPGRGQTEPRAADRASAQPASVGSAAPPDFDPDSAPWMSSASTQQAGGAVAVAVAPARSGAAKGSAAGESLDVNRLVERWGEVVSEVRAGKRAMLATALERATPITVTARGDVTLELDEQVEMYARAIEEGAADVLVSIGKLFQGASRLKVVMPGAPGDAPPQRLTEAAVKGERLELLCRRDESLAAAVQALDLELVD